jgi:hypothetical protein
MDGTIGSVGARQQSPGILRRLAWVLVAVAALGTPGLMAQSCDPATTPCQTCPQPSCGPLPAECLLVGGGSNVSTVSTDLFCTGNFDQTTIEVQLTIGAVDTLICYGPGGTTPGRVCAGTQALNTVTHNVTGPSPITIPTLSLWGLLAVAGLLGAVALRRLARPNA